MSKTGVNFFLEEWRSSLCEGNFDLIFLFVTAGICLISFFPVSLGIIWIELDLDYV